MVCLTKQMIYRSPNDSRLSTDSTMAELSEEAADDVGMAASTGRRWAERRNEGGLGLLTPTFGGGRPPRASGPP